MILLSGGGLTIYVLPQGQGVSLSRRLIFPTTMSLPITMANARSASMGDPSMPEDMEAISASYFLLSISL